MLNIGQRPQQSLILRGLSTVLVQVKPGAPTVKVVQTVSPVPVSGQSVDYIDGGNF